MSSRVTQGPSLDHPPGLESREGPPSDSALREPLKSIPRDLGAPGGDSDSESRRLVRGSRAVGQGRDSSHFLLAWTRDRPAYSGTCTTEPLGTVWRRVTDDRAATHLITVVTANRQSSASSHHPSVERS